MKIVARHFAVRGLLFGTFLGALSCGDGDPANTNTPLPCPTTPSAETNDLFSNIEYKFSPPISLALDKYPGVTLDLPASAKVKPSYTKTTITGDLTLTAGSYTVTMGKASLDIDLSLDGKSVTSIAGTAQVTFPELHTFSGLGVASPLAATIGYDYGDSDALSATGLPLLASRKYIYVTFNAGFNASLGSSSIGSNAGVSDTLVFNPSDPSVYFAGDMGLVTAVGLSEKGLIPFVPSTTWGLDDGDLATFNGQTYTAGQVSLEEIPLVVTGNVTTSFTGWDGRSPLKVRDFAHSVGINGSLNLGWDFLDGAFNFSLPVANASLYIQSTVWPYQSTAWVSGTAGTATFLPPWIPALLSANSNVAGYLDTAHPENTHFDGSSDVVVQASILGKAIGLPMNDMTLSAATYHVDRLGFRFTGTSTNGLTTLLPSTSATITACFGGNTTACLSDDTTQTAVKGSKEWLIQVEGDTSLFGVPLASGTVTANSAGLALTASYKTPVSLYTMTGTVSASDAQVTGSATVSLPLNDVNQVLAEVVDGVLCGYKEVTDIAKCGYDAVDFGDEFHCGKPHCSWSWRHGLRCSISCHINVPRTCSDLTQPNTCTPNKPAPFNLGSVSGAVAMTINKSGISGKFSGSFCPASGSCISLSEKGTVDFSDVNNPRICMSTSEISAALPSGTFCVKF